MSFQGSINLSKDRFLALKFGTVQALLDKGMASCIITAITTQHIHNVGILFLQGTHRYKLQSFYDVPAKIGSHRGRKRSIFLQGKSRLCKFRNHLSPAKSRHLSILSHTVAVVRMRSYQLVKSSPLLKSAVQILNLRLQLRITGCGPGLGKHFHKVGHAHFPGIGATVVYFEDMVTKTGTKHRGYGINGGSKRSLLERVNHSKCSKITQIPFILLGRRILGMTCCQFVKVATRKRLTAKRVDALPGCQGIFRACKIGRASCRERV